MTLELREKIARLIIDYHVSQKRTRSGRGFFLGTKQDQEYMLIKIFRDLDNAGLFVETYTSVSKETVEKIIQLTFSGAIHICTSMVTNYWKTPKENYLRDDETKKIFLDRMLIDLKCLRVFSPSVLMDSEVLQNQS